MIVWQDREKDVKIDALTRLVPKKKFELLTLAHICREEDGTFSTAETEAGFKPDRHFRCFFLYYEGKRLVGELFIFLTDRDHGEITAIVDPCMRRGGIFTKLLEAAREELDKYDIKEWYIVAEPGCEAANAVRGAMGFETVYSELVMELVSDGAGKDAARDDADAPLRDADAGEGNAVPPEGAVDGEGNAVLPEGAEDGYSVHFEDTEDGFAARLESVSDGKAAGSAQVSIFRDTAFISHVEIGENLRGRGLGKLLTGSVISKLFAGGTSSIKLQVSSPNTAAVSLYEKLGFKTVSQLDFVREKSYNVK